MSMFSVGSTFDTNKFLDGISSSTQDTLKLMEAQQKSMNQTTAAQMEMNNAANAAKSATDAQELAAGMRKKMQEGLSKILT